MYSISVYVDVNEAMGTLKNELVDFLGEMNTKLNGMEVKKKNNRES